MDLIFQTPFLAVKISPRKNFFSSLITALSIYYFLFSRKLIPKLRNTPFPLRVYYKHKLISYYLHNPMDVASLVEVYVLNEYEWHIQFEPKIILDLGAHFGDSTLYYHAIYPHAKIYAVEPDPYNFSRLIENTQKIENISAINCAVGDKDGIVDFYKGVSSLGHSLKRRGAKDEIIKIEQKTLDSLLTCLDLEMVDLMKFDIEGGEFSFLSDLTHKKIKNLIGELHFDLVDGWDIARIKVLLCDYDLSLQKLKTDSRYIVRAFRK